MLKRCILLFMAVLGLSTAFCGCSGQSDGVDKDTDIAKETTTETESTDEPTICERFPNKGEKCVIYVNQEKGNNESGRGDSWDSSFSSMYVAKELDALVKEQCGLDCEIWVAKGRYSDRDFSLDSGDKIFGGFNGDESLLSERDPKSNESVIIRKISIDGDTVLDGIVKRGQDIVVKSGTVSVNESSFIRSAGLSVDGGLVELKSTSFEKRSTNSESLPAFIVVGSEGELRVIDGVFSEGAEVKCYGGGNAEIENSVFRDASGIKVTGECFMSVKDTEFTEGEKAKSSPGGPYVSIWNNDGENSEVVLDGCVFHDISRDSGDIESHDRHIIEVSGYNGDAKIEVLNTVFHSNHGGALIMNNTGYVELYNVLMHTNSVDDSIVPDIDAGMKYGVIAGRSQGKTAKNKIRNSIFLDNYPDTFVDYGNFAENAEYDVAYSMMDKKEKSGQGVIYTTPVFMDAENSDFRLAPGSPGIDAGDGDAAPEFDMNGNPRVDDPDVENTGKGTPNYVDMGPFERQLEK